MEVTRHHALETALQNSKFPVFIRLNHIANYTGNQYSIAFRFHSYRESCCLRSQVVESTNERKKLTLSTPIYFQVSLQYVLIGSRVVLFKDIISS